MQETLKNTLVCPKCRHTLQKHGPDQGFCPYGHGIIVFNTDSEGKVMSTRQLLTSVKPVDLPRPRGRRPYQIRPGAAFG